MLKSTGRKSQLEIVGLVVIVILISLALLFYLQFSLRKTPEIKKTYTNSQLTSNMVNALLETSTNCKGNTIAILLADCAGNYDREGILYDCNDDGIPDSCSFVENTIQDLLEKTLDKWDVKYQLSAFFAANPDNPIIYFANDFKCAGNIESSPDYFISVRGRLMIVRLEVCVD